MSPNRPQVDASIQRPYRIAPTLRAHFDRRQSHLAMLGRRARLQQRRYWTRVRERRRNLIHGALITHRRMFGVSHKHVQPGEVPAEKGG